MNLDSVIVLGCPRSGTTYLLRILEALDNTEAISGWIFPPHVAHLVNQPMSVGIHTGLARALAFCLHNHLDNAASYRTRAIERWIRGSLSTWELVLAIKRKRAIHRLIYKEPFWAFSPEFVYEALPASRIVHMYRDGRDCADSLVRTFDVLTDEKLHSLNSIEAPMGRKYDDRYAPWWVADGQEQAFLKCTPYVRAIWMWKEMVGRCHEFSTRRDVIASGRVISVKYEELINDPDAVGRDLFEKIGATMTPTAQKRLSRAHSSSIGAHRNRDPGEIEQAEKLAKRELGLCGYL